MTPRFQHTYCAQCLTDIGPGDDGVARCADHSCPTIGAAAPTELRRQTDAVELDWSAVADKDFDAYFQANAAKLVRTHPARLVRQLAARLHLALTAKATDYD